MAYRFPGLCSPGHRNPHAAFPPRLSLQPSEPSAVSWEGGGFLIQTHSSTCWPCEPPWGVRGESGSISSEPGIELAARGKEVRQLAPCWESRSDSESGHPCGHCSPFGAAESDTAEDILVMLPAGLRTRSWESRTRAEVVLDPGSLGFPVMGGQVLMERPGVLVPVTVVLSPCSAQSPPDSALVAASLFPSRPGFRQGGGGGPASAQGAQRAANRKQENKTAPWPPTRLTLTLPPPSLAPAHSHGPLFLLLRLGFPSLRAPRPLSSTSHGSSVLACPCWGQQVTGSGREGGPDSSTWLSLLAATPSRAQAFDSSSPDPWIWEWSWPGSAPPAPGLAALDAG